MPDAIAGLLLQGASAVGVPLQSGQSDALLKYLALLERWNNAYNLTAVRNREQMAVRHLLDSLAIGPHLTGQRFIDVGTGAGLPGIPLAISYPEQQWTLLDSNGKKTRFLFQVKSQLGLSNIELAEARVEDWVPKQLYDGALSRAFADLSQTCDLCRHLLSPQGHLYAMKSQLVAKELETVPGDYRLKENVSLSVPGLNEERWLTVLQRSVNEE
jgi:16S rRNA (guanine527-N7)-methyltransferase